MHCDLYVLAVLTARHLQVYGNLLMRQRTFQMALGLSFAGENIAGHARNLDLTRNLVTVGFVSPAPMVFPISAQAESVESR